MPKISHQQTYPLGSSASADDLASWLRSLPGDAQVTVSTQEGDWNYASVHSLIATWTTEASSGW